MTKTLSKYKPTAISSGAMADIAFLLLIFFFVSTTIEEEQGILVKLPPYEFEKAPPIPSKNVFNVLVNSANQLMVEQKLLPIDQLQPRMTEFILNPVKRPDLPSKPTTAVVSFQCDRGTDYAKYIEVYNVLKKTYHDIWQQRALHDYGQSFEELPEKVQSEIKSELPMLISEAEPTNFE